MEPEVLVHLDAEKRKCSSKRTPCKRVRRQRAGCIERISFHEESKHSGKDKNDTEPEKPATDNGDYRMNARIDCPCEPKQSDHSKPASEDRRWKSIFGLRLALT